RRLGERPAMGGSRGNACGWHVILLAHVKQYQTIVSLATIGAEPRSPFKGKRVRGHAGLLRCGCGAGRENRTLMVLPPRDFESRASTNSAIPAREERELYQGHSPQSRPYNPQR